MLSRGDGVVLGERADRAALLKKTMRGASYAVARRRPGEPIRRFEAARHRPLDRRIRLRARSRDHGNVTLHQTYYTFVGAGRFDGLFVLLFSTCTAKPIVVVVYAVCELHGRWPRHADWDGSAQLGVRRATRAAQRPARGARRPCGARCQSSSTSRDSASPRSILESRL